MMKKSLYYLLSLFLFFFLFLGCSKKSKTSNSYTAVSEQPSEQNDKNEVLPEISFVNSMSVKVRENQSNVTKIVAEDANGEDLFTYSITDGDSDFFDINSSSGVIVFKDLPDYETKTSYTFSVEAKKNGVSAFHIFKVELENLNDNAPYFYNNDTVTVGEHQLFVLQLIGLDNDGDELVYSLQNDDANFFNIDSQTGEITFKEAPDAEEKTHYTFKAKISDGIFSAYQKINVFVKNVNEYTPVFTNSSQVTVAENQQDVVLLQAEDQDGVENLSYYIKGDDFASFKLNAQTGLITFKNSPDYETKSLYKFQAIVSDGEKNSDINMSIYITNENDNAPTFISDANIFVKENQKDVVTLDATDIDGDSLRYSISGTDKGFFNVDKKSGVIRFKNLPDYEKQKVYNLIATVSDGDFSTDQSLRVELINENDNAPIFLNKMDVVLDENVTSVMKLEAKDADGNHLTFSIDGKDAKYFTINKESGEIIFKEAPDYEKRGFYTFNAIVSDTTLSTSARASVTICNVNESIPYLTSATQISVQENKTFVMNLQATDEDNESVLSFAILERDADKFDLNTSSGEITFKKAPDYEEKTSYSFKATVSDGTYTSSKTLIKVAIENVNEFTPEFTMSTNVNVDENQPNAIKLSATDKDSNANLVFSIDEDDAASFDINKTSGLVTFKTLPDYETKREYLFIATVSDGKHSSEKDIHININNVNEYIPELVNDNNVSVEENQLFAIRLKGEDKDSEAHLSYFISGEDAESFDVNKTTGKVLFKEYPDYETKSLYSFIAKVSDDDNASEQNITVNIINVNEFAPEFTMDSSVIVEENQLDVMFLEASDKDGNEITFAIDDGDEESFILDKNTGEITFKEAPDYEVKNRYTFTAIVTDGERSSSQEVVVNISDYIFPFQTAKFLVDDPAISDNLGSSVAISDEYIVLGARNTNDSAGAVYVFKRNSDKGNDVTLLDKIDAGNDSESDAYFGCSVAIDGKYIIVGSYKKDLDGRSEAGAAYLFKIDDDDTITKLYRIEANDAQDKDEFGYAVDIDGKYILVGALLEDSDSDVENAGSAYLYEIISDENVTQVAKIESDDIDKDDRFGNDVAIDGDYILIGASYDKSDDKRGKAYLFKKDENNSIKQVAEMFEADEDGNADGKEKDKFGYSVDLYGNHFVIGAYNDDIDGIQTMGAAYVYQYDENNTVKLLKKIGPDDAEEEDHFGNSVSISKNYVLVGSYNDDEAGSNSGSAYLFIIKDNNNVVELKKLQSADIQESDLFGNSVAIDNNYMVIGAQGSDIAVENAGSAYLFSAEPLDEVYIFNVLNSTKDENFVGDIYDISNIVKHPYHDINFVLSGDDADSFELNGTVFRIPTALNYEEPEDKGRNNIYDIVLKVKDEESNLLDNIDIKTKIKNLYYYYLKNENPDDERATDGARFGISVSSSGEYIVVGADQYNGTSAGDGDNEGAIYIYRKKSDTQVELLKEMQADIQAANDHFGYSVSIDGDYIISGTPYADVTKNGTISAENGGRVYLIKRNSDDDIKQEDKFDLGDDAQKDDHLGWSVAISGNFFIAGVPDQEDDVDSNSSGLAYSFKISDDEIEKVQSFKADETATEDQFGWSVAISGKYIIVGAPKHNLDGEENAGSAYLFKRDDSGHITQKFVIRADDGKANDNFGTSVATNGEYIIVGAPGDDDARGSAYIFKIKSSGADVKQLDKIYASDGAKDDQFGYSVAITQEYALVGSKNDDREKYNAGSAYLFAVDADGAEDDEEEYDEVDRMNAPDIKENDYFATSLTLNDNYIVIGKIESDTGDETGTEKGDIYIFNKDPE